MKKSFYGLLISVVLLISVFAGENEFVKNAEQLYKANDYVSALQVLDEGLKENPSSMKLAQLKYYILLEVKKYDEALDLLDGAIQVLKGTEDQEDLLGEKIRALTMMGRYKEGAVFIEGSEEMKKLKSHWVCMSAVKLYLKQKNKDKAFEWLEKTEERGFISYNRLYEDDFKLLHHDARLKKIVKKIKIKIGIGKPAKNFTVDLLKGGKFTLSKQKGKVVLVDFWSTSCLPCKKEIPILKAYYSELNQKGFEIIGISFDSKKEKLEKFLAEVKPQWKIAFSGKGWGDEIRKLYGVSSIPSHWLVDKEGVLRYFDLKGKELKKAVVKLLAEE